MSKRCIIALWSLIFIICFSTVALAQSEDLIDKIKIIAIEKIAVGDNNTLDVTVRFRNDHDQQVMFKNSDGLTFAIGSWKKGFEGDIIDPVKNIGSETFEYKDPLTENGDTSITFHVNMGDNAEAFEVMKHLIDCIGDPKNKQPFIPITGALEIAVYSPTKRGWTTKKDFSIDWKFVPDLHKNVYFMPGG